MKQLFKSTEFIIASASVIVTIIVSAIFGFTGSTIIGTFWSWFWISLLTQVIGFFVVNSFLLQKKIENERILEIQEMKEISKFSINLNCAYCKQANITPIILNKKNTFKCDACNQVNGVFMQFTATTLTTPIDVNPQLKDIS